MANNFSIAYKMRFFSLPFLASRLKEEGLLWFLRGAGRKLGLLLVVIVMTPPALLLVLAKVRFVQEAQMVCWMGNLAHEPDVYIKSALLGWSPWYHFILLAPTRDVANPSMLGYWEKYIKIIRNPVLINLLRPLRAVPYLQRRLAFVNLPDGSISKHVPANYLIQAKYESELGGQPLLNISDRDYENGWRCLRGFGVPQDAWFVCLHVREGGYHPSLEYHSYRDAGISDSMLAVKEITKRGGWVIRMGDPSMTPLAPMDQVIDYVHSDAYRDWMDVFLFSQCKFVLGSTSGAVEIAKVFGVPAVLTNYVPMGHGAHSGNDIWTPKLFWSNGEERYLTFLEVLLSPLRNFSRTETFENQGISVLDNSPEEIRDLAVEIMERLDGKALYSAADEDLQIRFNSLLAADPIYATGARVGRDFLRTYAWLLPDV